MDQTALNDLESSDASGSGKLYEASTGLFV